MSIEAMTQALAALETCRIRSVSEWEVSDVTPKNVTAAISALRAALSQQPATGEPVAQWQKRHPVRTGGRWISTDEHDAKWWSERATGWEARALYTHPAPSGLGDVVRDAAQEAVEELHKLNEYAIVYINDPEWTRVSDTCQKLIGAIDAAIDDAMPSAQAQKGQP